LSVARLADVMLGVALKAKLVHKVELGFEKVDTLGLVAEHVAMQAGLPSLTSRL
jgi:hypothetical protein